MDVASSIAGLVGLTDIVVGYAIKYCQKVKNAEKGISNLVSEIISFRGALEGVKYATGKLSSTQQDFGVLTRQEIASCYSTLQELQDLLRLDDLENPYQSEGILGPVRRRFLHWPSIQSQVDELLKRLERSKSQLSLTFQADSW